jgi:cell division protein FtsB
VAQLRSQRRRKSEHWHKANRALIALILAGVALLGSFLFYPEIETRKELARQLEEEQAVLRSEEAQRALHRREVHLLENDPEYVEIIARDRIGVMKEGETIFRFDTPSAKAGQQPPR